MGQLDGISEDLKRQRRDIDDSIEATSNRTGRTADLLAKIEELRRRTEDTAASGGNPAEALTKSPVCE